MTRTPNHKQALSKWQGDTGILWPLIVWFRNFRRSGRLSRYWAGFNDPEYLLAPEFVQNWRHVYGRSRRRKGWKSDNLSARCQFYIVKTQRESQRLDGDYTSEYIKGMDIKSESGRVPRTVRTLQLNQITMTVSINLFGPRKD